MQVSRRELALGALAMAPFLGGLGKPARRGIQLGVQTYSFRDMLAQPGNPIDRMVEAMRFLRLDIIELFEPSIQPQILSADAPWRVTADGVPTQASLFGRPPEGGPTKAELENREKIRQWRLDTPLSHFEQIGRQFSKAGIKVQGFNFGLKEDCTDAEVDRGFAITRALGADVLTASTTLKMAERTIPFAAKHKIKVGMHGHSNLHDPNQLATPDSFERCLAMSPFYRINLDIGHFSAVGFDTIGFMKQHHARIISVHLKDRKNNDGPNVPFGEGNTPIRETVRFIRDNKYPIPAFIEYEYAGGVSVPQVAICRNYVDAALA